MVCSGNFAAADLIETNDENITHGTEIVFASDHIKIILTNNLNDVISISFNTLTILSSRTNPPPSDIQFASLKRRLICLVYEAILLFGVFFATDLMFEVTTQRFQENSVHHWRQLTLFVVIGIYFCYFWRHTGQTLPMQTWGIKIVSATTLQAPTWRQAGIRYCCAWMWFLPALSVNYFFEIKQWPSLIVLLIGMLFWAFISQLDKNGQFLHDKLAGTQLVLVPVQRTR